MFMPGFCFCLWGFFEWSQQNGASPTNSSVLDYLLPHTGFGPGGMF